MTLGFVLAMATQMAEPASAPDPLPRMAALYEEACLAAFPDDAVLDRLMTTRAIRPLTADEVKVTLRDDPGRGWLIENGGRPAFVFLELPPFHACSVRWVGPEAPFDLAPYRPVAARYRAAHPGFTPARTHEGDLGALHVRIESEERPLPGGGADTLMMIDQHAADPASRAQGEMTLRFVHQVVTGRSTPASLNARSGRRPPGSSD